MFARSYITVANPSRATLPHRSIRNARQFRLAKACNSNTSAEAIEILERSGTVGREFNGLAPASTIAVFTIMVVATFSLLAMQLPGWSETQLQFSVGDVARVIAGR